MKKFIFFLFLLLCASEFTQAGYAEGLPADNGPVWLPAAAGNVPANATLETRLISENISEFTVSFSGIWAAAVETNQSAYTALYLDEYGHSFMPGQPDLPHFTLQLEIPPGMQLKVDGVQTKFTTLSLPDYNLPGRIIPVQPPSPKTETTPDWVAPLDEIYREDQFFQESPYAPGEAYTQRGRRIQVLYLFPVLYSPVRAELQLLQSVTVQYRWVSAAETAMDMPDERLRTPGFDSLSSDAIDIPLLMDNGVKSFSLNEEGFLIICPASFLTGVAPLATLKQNQGFSVSVASENEVGSFSNPQNIKNYIQNAYDSWENPPVYVLLVGDSNLIPAWSFRSSGAPIPPSRKTDLYYATMDGSTDFVPDLFYGRLPARNSAQLQAMIAKLIAYSNSSGAESWVKKATFISTCDQNHYAGTNAVHNFVIDQYTAGLGYTGNYPENPQAGGDQLYCRTGTNATLPSINTLIAGAMNDQRSLVVYSGHGNESGWADHYIDFDKLSIQNLAANSAFPLITSFACFSGDFANSEHSESLGEAWLAEAGKGAIAFLGSADYSYWTPDDFLEKSFFAALFSNADDPPPLGQVIFSSKQAFHLYNPVMNQYYWETYNLLGDPSMKIWMEPRQDGFYLYLPEEGIRMCAGQEKTSSLEVNAVSGFSETVNLSISGLPAGVSALFNPQQVVPSATADLTLTALSTAAAGRTEVTIQGTAGGQIRSLLFPLDISTSTPAPAVLLSPAHLSTDHPLKATFTWQAAGPGHTYRLQVAHDAAFQHIILDLPELQTNTYTMDFDLASLHTYFWRVRAENMCGEGEFSEPARFNTVAGVGDCAYIGQSSQLYENDFESGTAGWLLQDWAANDERYLSPNTSLHATAAAVYTSKQLVSPLISLADAGAEPTLRFWQWRELESSQDQCIDGGNLEFRFADEDIWVPVTPLILRGLQDGSIINSQHPLNNLAVWCGKKDWEEVVVDLSLLSGREAQFRFTLGTNNEYGSEGWYIDDFKIQTCTENYRFSMDASSKESSRMAGQMAEYTLRILNESAPDSYRISLSGNLWPVEVDILQSGPVDYYETASFHVQVKIPVGAEAGESDQVLVTVVSEKDEGIQKQILLTTTVLETHFIYLPLTIR